MEVEIKSLIVWYEDTFKKRYEPKEPEPVEAVMYRGLLYSLNPSTYKNLRKLWIISEYDRLKGIKKAHDDVGEKIYGTLPQSSSQ